MQTMRSFVDLLKQRFQIRPFIVGRNYDYSPHDDEEVLLDGNLEAVIIVERPRLGQSAGFAPKVGEAVTEPLAVASGIKTQSTK
jgi:hypothetical protein